MPVGASTVSWSAVSRTVALFSSAQMAAWVRLVAPHQIHKQRPDNFSILASENVAASCQLNVGGLHATCPDVPPAALTFVTDFADQAVILPEVAVVFLILLAQRRWRVAGAWMLAVPGVLGTLLLLKIAGYACGWLLPALDLDRLALRSPSGHVASAAVVCSGIVVLQAGRLRMGAISAALSAALAVAGVIGTTRVLLGAHSVSEVIVAAGIGGAGSMAFAWLSGRHLLEKSGLPIAAAAAAVLVLFHGCHLPAETVIQSAAAETLRQWVPACQPD